MWPSAHIIIRQEDQKDENYIFDEKNRFIIGNHEKCDIKLKHKSISKFHSALYFSTNMELVLVDLNSTNGTKILRNQS